MFYKTTSASLIECVNIISSFLEEIFTFNQNSELAGTQKMHFRAFSSSPAQLVCARILNTCAYVYPYELATVYR